IDPAGDIRLVRLLPKQTQGIICEIIHVPLASAPAYEAFSYSWGTNIRDQNLLCTDEYTKGEARNLAITANLMTALRRLQLEKEPRNLWIDQISINQSDDREKVHQVCMMGHIYERCVRVIIWLGEETDELR
ncbi:HET-domain-containing protein, partial [Glonium stellatum]